MFLHQAGLFYFWYYNFSNLFTEFFDRTSTKLFYARTELSRKTTTFNDNILASVARLSERGEKRLFGIAAVLTVAIDDRLLIHEIVFDP